MQRIKVSTNFYLDEFVHKDIYNQFGEFSRRYFDNRLIAIAEYVRSISESSVTINNWATGGIYVDSGVRDFRNPHNLKAIFEKTKKNSISQLNYMDLMMYASLSRHYFGLCIDLKFNKNSEIVYNKIMGDKTIQRELMSLGVTTFEDIEYTKGKDGKNGWLHISTEYTGKKEIQIIKP